MSTKLPLLFNPRSGPKPKDPDALMRKLPLELRSRIAPTVFEAPFDFAPHIHQAVLAGGPLLVWGGDGTLHHAGRALIEAGSPVALGAIPGGSGNGLVRGLRTPLEPAGAVIRLLEGRELRIDLPRLDGASFLNLCGTGFEAVIAQAFEREKGRGLAGYVKTIRKLWRTHPETPLSWDALQPEAPDIHSRMDTLRTAWRGPEPPLPSKAWSLCIANLPQFGSGFWIAPSADPTDGILQWASLAKPSLLDLLMEGPALFCEGARSTLRQEGRLLRGVLHLPQALPWHLDGEAVEARDRAELSLEPRAFRMQVTNACVWH
jgi:diacylglycerol kinase (ATP)